YPRQLLEVVAKVGLVANVDGIAFTAFDVLGDVLPANAGGNRTLHILDRQAVTGGLWPIDLDVHIEALRYSLGKDPADIRQSRKQLLDLCSHRLYLLHRFALHF